MQTKTEVPLQILLHVGKKKVPFFFARRSSKVTSTQASKKHTGKKGGKELLERKKRKERKGEKMKVYEFKFMSSSSDKKQTFILSEITTVELLCTVNFHLVNFLKMRR